VTSAQAGSELTTEILPLSLPVPRFRKSKRVLFITSQSVTLCCQGHSPAGGCLMAMSCDYRVMATGKYAIGLNETLLVSDLTVLFMYICVCLWK